MKYWHKRVEVSSFYDLEPEFQIEELEYYGIEVKENSYFISENGEYWSMGNFMRSSGGRYDGVMGVTNTSAIGVVLSCSGDSAVLQCFG
jgi:hypothetical protein